MKYFVLLGLLALAGMAFAGSGNVAQQCAESCCDSYGGDWKNGACTDLSSTYTKDYQDCSTMCAQYASGGCCGPAFLLLGIAGAAFIVRR